MVGFPPVAVVPFQRLEQQVAPGTTAREALVQYTSRLLVYGLPSATAAGPSQGGARRHFFAEPLLPVQLRTWLLPAYLYLVRRLVERIAVDTNRQQTGRYATLLCSLLQEALQATLRRVGSTARPPAASATDSVLAEDRGGESASGGKAASPRSGRGGRRLRQLCAKTRSIDSAEATPPRRSTAMPRRGRPSTGRQAADQYDARPIDGDNACALVLLAQNFLRHTDMALHSALFAVAQYSLCCVLPMYADQRARPGGPSRCGGCCGGYGWRTPRRTWRTADAAPPDADNFYTVDICRFVRRLALQCRHGDYPQRPGWHSRRHGRRESSGSGSLASPSRGGRKSSDPSPRSANTTTPRAATATPWRFAGPVTFYADGKVQAARRENLSGPESTIVAPAVMHCGQAFLQRYRRECLAEQQHLSFDPLQTPSVENEGRDGWAGRRQLRRRLELCVDLLTRLHAADGAPSQFAVLGCHVFRAADLLLPLDFTHAAPALAEHVVETEQRIDFCHSASFAREAWLLFTAAVTHMAWNL